MDGKLPEIYWYVFWCVVVGWCFIGLFIAGRNDHKRNMKALEILQTYAEKGIEPPPGILEPLTKQVFERTAQQAEAKKAATRGATYLGRFAGGLAAAGLTGGIAWWWFTAKIQPEWVAYM